MKFKPLEKSKSLQDVIDNLDSEILDYSTLSPDDIRNREFIIKSVLINVRDRLRKIDNDLNNLAIMGDE